MGIPHFKNEKEIRDWTGRERKTETEMTKTTNKSCYDLKNQKLLAGEYFGRNFSLCDFGDTDISGCKFRRCNFSFAIDLDKAKTDLKTEFIECNLSGADLPLKHDKCNTRRFTDAEIEEQFKER